MTLQEIQQEIERKARRIAECERDAKEHEQKARDLHAERASVKIELAELRQQIHNAATQSAATQSLAEAKAAEQRASKAAHEVEKLRDELASQLAELKAAKEVKAE